MPDAALSADILSEGIAAARGGERAKAREKFTRILRYDQQNEQAWLWMSSVVESDRERVLCLNNVLKLNPANRTAKRGLALLGSLPPELRADLDIEVIGVSTGVPGPAERPKRPRFTFRRSRRLENILIAVLALGIVGVIGTAVFQYVRERQRLAAIVPPTPVPPTATITPTATDTPTATAMVRTATAVVNTTPLAVLKGFTATATPEPFSLPFYPEEEYARGEKAYKAGDYDTALGLFDAAIKANPQNASAHYYLGQIYLAKKNYSRAASEFNRALRIRPNLAPAHLGLGQANFGLGGNPLPNYDKAEQADPKWVEPYIQRSIYYASRRNRDAAIDELEAGRVLAPDNVVVVWHLAEQYVAAGRYDDAQQTLDGGVAIDPTALDLYRVQAVLGLAIRDYSTSQEALNLYLAYRPNDADGWTMNGQAYLGLGDATTALTALNRAIELGPRDPRQALVTRGRVQLLLGNPATAEKDFRSALSYGVTTGLRLSIGQAYFEVGDYAAAVAELKKAVESDRTLYDTQYWLGTAQVAAESYADAIQPLSEAVTRATTAAQKFDALYQRAQAYEGAGETNSAVLDLRDLLVLNVAGRAEEQASALTQLRKLGGPLPGPTQTATATR